MHHIINPESKIWATGVLYQFHSEPKTAVKVLQLLLRFICRSSTSINSDHGSRSLIGFPTAGAAELGGIKG